MPITSSSIWEVVLRMLGLVRVASIAVPLAWVLVHNQPAWAQGSVSVSPQSQVSSVRDPAPLVPIEERLLYLRKLKIVLEADPLDIAEFERQFEVNFVCKPWRDTGKICDYHTNGMRWPYAVFDDNSNAVRYRMYGDGTNDSLWINLLYPNDRQAHNCITGEMVRQVFTPPEWVAQAGVTNSLGTRPVRMLILAIDGRDQQRRRVTLVSAGVKGCTGKLQITVHPNKL